MDAPPSSSTAEVRRGTRGAGTADALAAAGWLAVNVDQRGHGESEWSPDGVYDLDRFAGDAATVASAFDRPVLIGASLGGISALTAIGESTSDRLGIGARRHHDPP